MPINSNNPGTATLKGIADVNGDGALDLIIADPYDAAILVLLGDNSGNFTLGSRLTDFDYPTVIYAADLNGDGHIDFVANGEVGKPQFGLPWPRRRHLCRACLLQSGRRRQRRPGG